MKLWIDSSFQVKRKGVEGGGGRRGISWGLEEGDVL
jgi:hypothetical protein